MAEEDVNPQHRCNADRVKEGAIASVVKPETSSDLPLELWTMIFEHLYDPFDLWITCRQISSQLRREAESCFRLWFLPRLFIDTYYDPKDIDRDISINITTSLDDDACSNLSSSTASFRVEVKDRSLRPLVVGRGDMAQLRALVQKALDWKDINTMDRTYDIGAQDVPLHCVTVYFDRSDIRAVHVNDPQFSVLQFNLELVDEVKDGSNIHAQVTLDWKKLMTSFFAEEVFVRRRMARAGIFMAELSGPATLMADAHDTLATECPSILKSDQSYTVVENEECTYNNVRYRFMKRFKHGYPQPSNLELLYIAAYYHRLSKAYAKEGHHMPASGTADRVEISARINAHVCYLGWKKERHVAQCAENLWYRKFGNIEFLKKEEPAVDESVTQSSTNSTEVFLDTDCDNSDNAI
jgi:hypothetical protein